jgi:hypothetical protein
LHRGIHYDSERSNIAQVAGSTVDLQPNLYKYVFSGAKGSGPTSRSLNAHYLWIPGLAM